MTRRNPIPPGSERDKVSLTEFNRLLERTDALEERLKKIEDQIAERAFREDVLSKLNDIKLHLETL